MAPKPYKKYLTKEAKADSSAKGSRRFLLTSNSFFWWLLIGVGSFLILAINFTPDQISLKEGEIATSNTYYFGTATTFVSQEQTNEAKKLVASEVKQIYNTDNLVVLDLHQEVDQLFNQLNTIKNDETLGEDEKIEAAYKTSGDTIPEASLRYYFNASGDVSRNLAATLKESITKSYDAEIADEQLPQTIEDVKKQINNANYLEHPRKFLLGMVDCLSFRPNKVFDQVATLDAVEKAVATVQPIQVTVKSGQLLVGRGEEVTKFDLETLIALGLQKKSGEVKAFVGLFFLVLVCFYLLQNYCNHFNPDILKQQSSLSVLGTLILIILLLSKFITSITINTSLNTDLMMGLIIPMPAFAMLAAALVNKQAAIFATLIVSIFVGIMCDGHMLYILTSLLGGLIGVVQVSNMDQRGKYAVAALNISVMYTLVVLGWCFIWDYTPVAVGMGIIMALVNGVVSVILAIGTLPFFESAFKITTEIRLLELSNTNHPLLKKLMIEAPGTYNHSVLVGNLAEAAADRIGANGLLTRVASYFHDIGKIRRPYFFIENQKPADNPHDKLQPSLSTFIITSHTKEGSEIAKKYKLPVEIIDVIEQHHGTSLVASFYHKAKENALEAGSVDEIRAEDFRYLGPKPQTKEAALVMLADSCQAAVQAMSAPTRGQMEGRVREVIKGKFDDNQLMNCDLTFKDLDVIATSFTQVLYGVNHHRINYPAQLEQELEARAKENRKLQFKGVNFRPDLKEDARKEEIRKEEIRKEEIKKDEIKKDDAQKGEAPKDEGMKGAGSKELATKEGEGNRVGSNKEAAKAKPAKEISPKDNIKKPEILPEILKEELKKVNQEAVKKPKENKTKEN